MRGHSRPVTFVLFGPGGKSLFTCGKDKLVIAWSVPEGERLVQYEGHQGAVWGCSVSGDGRFMLSCGADNMVILWDVACAQQVTKVQLPGVARYVEWAPGLGQQRFVACSNKFMGHAAAVSMWRFGYGWGLGGLGWEPPTQLFSIEEPTLPSAALQVAWTGPAGDKLCSVHDSGEVLFWDSSSGILAGKLDVHKGPVSQVAFPMDRRLMASCGRNDMEVKLWDLMNEIHDDEPAGCEEGSEQPPKRQVATLLQSFTSDRPLNCVALRPTLVREEAFAWVGAVLGGLEPTRRHCCDALAGGGQDARDVALVGAGADGQFEPQLLRLGAGENFHAVELDDRRGRRGHFGPIHTVALSLCGTLCASGSEDGNVRLRELPSLAIRG